MILAIILCYRINLLFYVKIFSIFINKEGECRLNALIKGNIFTRRGLNFGECQFLRKDAQYSGYLWLYS